MQTTTPPLSFLHLPFFGFVLIASRRDHFALFALAPTIFRFFFLLQDTRRNAAAALKTKADSFIVDMPPRKASAASRSGSRRRATSRSASRSKTPTRGKKAAAQVQSAAAPVSTPSVIAAVKRVNQELSGRPGTTAAAPTRIGSVQRTWGFLVMIIALLVSLLFVALRGIDMYKAAP